MEFSQCLKNAYTKILELAYLPKFAAEKSFRHKPTWVDLETN